MLPVNNEELRFIRKNNAIAVFGRLKSLMSVANVIAFGNALPSVEDRAGYLLGALFLTMR